MNEVAYPSKKGGFRSMLLQAPAMKRSEPSGCNRQLAVVGTYPDAGLGIQGILQQHTKATVSFIIAGLRMKINWYFHFSYNNRIVFMVTIYDKIVRLCHEKNDMPTKTLSKPI